MDVMQTAAIPRTSHQRSSIHAWLVWALFFAAVVVIASRPWQSSAVPAAATLGATDFSAQRAWTHVDVLARTIGRRVSGTEGSARAATYIEDRLRELGVETVRQVASGSTELDATTYVYRGIRNVLARVPGRSRTAILVSAHYDSGAEGPGAGDNALNVAAALEVVRAILAGGLPANTIIFNFADGEELGLLGAAAFAGHPWFEEIAAFVNLDASGPGGRQLLLQVTPGQEALLEAYASSARHVHGTVLAQEIFQVLPFDTDYHAYRNAGLGGIDLAPYGDGYAYHTSLDEPRRLSRRTLQESGENILALVRGLNALPPAPRDDTTATATYYDLLGLVMVRYSARAAFVAGIVVAVLSLIVVLGLPAEAGSDRGGAKAGSDRHMWLPASAGRWRLALLGAAAVAFSACLAILVPLLGAVVVTAAGRAMSWYARPWIAICVYGTLAAAGVLAGQALVRWLAWRRSLSTDAAAAVWQRGLVVFWALLLLAATALRLGSAYLPMWWCAGAGLAFVASMYLRAVPRWTLTLAGVTLAAITTVQAADLLLTSMVPLTGMLGADAPAELLIAAVAALAVAPFALLAAPSIRLAASRRRLAVCFAGLALVLIALVAWSFPYTPERPKRAYLDVRTGGAGGSHVAIETIDPGRDLAVKDVALDRAVARTMPTIEMMTAAPEGSGEPRAADVRLTAPGAYLVEVTIQGGTIASPAGGSTGGGTHLVWVGTEDPLTFRVTGAPGASLGVHAKAFSLGSDVPLDRVLSRLPRWAAPTVQTVLEASAGF